MEDIDINKLATLSKLTLSEAEALEAKGKLQKLLNLIENLRQLNLETPKVIA